MAEPPKSKIAAWGAEFDERDDAPAMGVNKELLRAALKLNPALRQNQGSTDDVMNMLQGAEQERAKAGTPAAAPQNKANVAVAIAEQRQKYEQDRRNLQQQIAALQKQLVDIGPKALERVLETFLHIDPNLTSPLTHEVLKSESKFLSEVNFTAKKLMDRQLKRK